MFLLYKQFFKMQGEIFKEMFFLRIESGESEGERLLAAGGMLGFLSHCHPEFISGSSEKGKSKEERVKREGGRGKVDCLAFASHGDDSGYPLSV